MSLTVKFEFEIVAAVEAKDNGDESECSPQILDVHRAFLPVDARFYRPTA